MLAVIVACEIGFWVFLGLGLLARYPLRMRRTGAALLLAVPLLDLVLLAATVIDIRGGAVATWQHGLAAAYLGFSVMFGHRTMKWADARFAHRFAGGPPPAGPPAGGMARARYEWLIWLRILAAYAITCALLLAMDKLIGDPHRTRALIEFMTAAAKVPLIALLWPISYTLWPKKTAPNPESHPTRDAPRS
ncbi:hypothetical protein [Microtetraspora niveoalba]|uniref:hypothetical protein n=1 Tax=Microtetraspora niveoalba TaxID=46175 RepID=UPI000A62BE3A|nr:hypothetical protein [Microtetraspora niveoalba]